MKTLFQNLIEQLKATSAAVRMAAAGALVLILGVAGVAGYRASHPHFELLLGNLDASEASQMTSALAGANIRFQLSQPPAPHVLYVESGAVYEAHNAIALAGAGAKSPSGIQTSDTSSSVFDGANERFQKSMKREWEEMEKQLTVLDFIVAAKVTTSIPERSSYRRDRPQTVAVTLTVRDGSELNRAQAETVAKLVRFRFGVPSENVIISDQSGHSVFDGSTFSNGVATDDIFENRKRYEVELQEKANSILDQVLGEGLAHVIVNSEWTYEQTETIKESYDPSSKVVIQKDTSSTSAPSGGSGSGSFGVGGATGTSGNIPGEFGTDSAGIPTPGVAPAGESKTKDESTSTVVGKETEHRVSAAPLLKRLSLSLFLDESLADREESLAASVQAAVGFVSERDKFSAMVVPFASVERDEEGNIVPPAVVTPPEPQSEIVTLLFERGVEIVAALAFVIVLLKSLKGGSKKKDAESEALAAAEAATTDEELDELDLDRLAVAQVEELVKNEPDKVAEILSRWALDDLETTKAGQ